MKILQEGRKAHQNWVGQQLQCPHCLCAWEIELNDKIYNHDGMWAMDCPNPECAQRNYIWSSRIIGTPPQFQKPPNPR